MADDRPRTPRTVLIPDHLWDALSAMAGEMGADRDALVNQALYTLARLNGFLVPSDLRRVAGDEAARAAGGLPTPREVRAGPHPGSRGRPPQPDPTPSPLPGRVLVLVADGRELERVVKDRFVIGRGKHCDLIINSGKVSREHAAIVRSGADWFIEDLGSSNGTWFDKRRISRRQIQDGDEYYISSEKLSCALR